MDSSSNLSAPATCKASIGDPANGLIHNTNLSCDIVSDADGYSYEYSWDGINWEINWFQTTYQSITVAHGDSPNIPVYYRVRAYKSFPMQYSNYTYASPQPIYTACDDGAPLTIEGVTSNSLNITLNPETPVENPWYTTYFIYYFTSGAAGYVQADGTLGAYPVFQTKNSWGTIRVSGLSNNSEYCFSAWATNKDDDSRSGPFTCVTTGINGPVLMQVNPLNYATITDNYPAFTMLFDKTVYSGAGNLKVYKFNTTTPVLTIPITAAMIQGNKVIVTYSSTIKGLDKNTNYYVLVDGSALMDNAGNVFAGVKDASFWNFKTGPNFATLLDTHSSFDYKIYPNPVRNELTIEIEGNTKKIDFEIFNTISQVVSTGSLFEKITIPTTSFVPGVYLIKFKSGNLYEFKKIIKE